MFTLSTGAAIRVCSFSTLALSVQQQKSTTTNAARDANMWDVLDRVRTLWHVRRAHNHLSAVGSASDTQPPAATPSDGKAVCVLAAPRGDTEAISAA